nr:MAG: holin family protein [Bacteriophage sp.]
MKLNKKGDTMENLYPIFVALVFNALDVLTGIVSAIKNKDIKSSKLRDGLFKKVGFIFCYFTAWLVDGYGGVIGFKLGVAILPVIVLYACTTELVSILENISKINSDLLPSKLMELFHISETRKE